MADSDLSLSGPHDEAEELLPWYATGQLSEAERLYVEEHLSGCTSCREQLVLEKRLVHEFRTLTPEVESGWSRIRARIDAPIVDAGDRAPTMLEQFFAVLRRPAVVGLAAAQLAFVIVAGSVLMSLSKPAYHTLGSASAPASANVIVMFKPDTKIREVDETLRSSGATIVEGPTDANAYLLHVTPRAQQMALSRLQSNNDVQLAQPIDGVAQ